MRLLAGGLLFGIAFLVTGHQSAVLQLIELAHFERRCPMLLFKLLMLVLSTMLKSQTPKARPEKSFSDKAYKGVLAVWAVGPLIATFIAIASAFRQGKIGRVPLALFFARWLLTGMGVTAGFHRLLTHKSYEAHPIVRLKLLILGTMAVQGKCIDWACFHLKHHAYADKPGDPHSPHTGEGEGWVETTKEFFHSHIGWFFSGDPADRELYGRSLTKDPLVVFVDKTTYFWVLLGFLIPYLIGGKKGLLWGGFVGMAFVNHATFAVNSVCHTFGSRRFDTDDQSRNNQWIAWITWGEGNHNNHHADPKSPFHGMKGQFDPTAVMIRLLMRLGLAHVEPRLVLTEEKAAIIQARLLRQQAERLAQKAA